MSDDPKETLKKFYEMWYPKALVEQLEKIQLSPSELLDYNQIRTIMKDYLNIIDKLTKEYCDTHPQAVKAHRTMKLLDGTIEEELRDTFIGSKSKWIEMLQSQKFSLRFITFFLIHFHKFFIALDSELDKGWDMETFEAQIKIGSSFYPLRNDYSFEEQAKIVRDSANFVIERLFRQMLVNIGTLLGEENHENDMMGNLYKKLGKYPLIKIVEFILDPDILALRNAASHNGFIIDIETEKILLFRSNKLVREATIGELWEIINKIYFYHSSYVISSQFIYYIVRYSREFDMEFGSYKFKIKIDRIKPAVKIIILDGEQTISSIDYNISVGEDIRDSWKLLETLGI